MQLTHTSWFHHICQVVLFTFSFSLFHPATLGVPWKIDVQFDSVTWNLKLGTWNWEFGPTPAYGQAQDPNLASTPEADTSDPFIVQKAAELGRDPQNIFAFVSNEIGYEAYQGSLRGARGTLWSKAGNALDQASLLIALLRASNIPARYVRGTLGTAEAQQLILSMFPPVLRIVGCPPADALKADPANDPKLLAEAKEHYWVEYGSSFTPADPTYPGAVVGQTFTTAQGTFSEVPDNLRHKVTVRLKAEISTVLGGPSFISATPGSTTNTTLSLTAAGNVNETVSLQATLPSGVSVSGLPGSVTLAKGETKTFPLTVSVGAGVLINQTLTATVTGTIAGAAQPNQRSTSLQVNIRSAAVVAVDQATLKSATAENTSLTQALSAFSTTLAQWEANPGNAALCQQAGLRVDNLIAVVQANASLASFLSRFQELRTRVTSCSSSDVASFASSLFTDMTVAIVPTGGVSRALALSVTPGNVELQPGQGKEFSVRLENRTTQPTTVSLSLGALPSGVTANLANTQVTLAGSEILQVPLTLSQTLVSMQIFALEVTATTTVGPHVASAHVAVRPALADVVRVLANPSAVKAGESVAVSAKVSNRACVDHRPGEWALQCPYRFASN